MGDHSHKSKKPSSRTMLALLLHCLWVRLRLGFLPAQFIVLCCVVLVAGLFYKTVSPCLLVYVPASLPKNPPKPPPKTPQTTPFWGRSILRFASSHISLLSGRFLALFFRRPLTFLRLTLRKNGIINGLVHLLLSGANCVFVYIIWQARES